MMNDFKKKYLMTAVLFIGLAAGETTFNAASYSYIFKVIEERNVDHLLIYLVLVITGYGVFSLLTYLKEYWINKTIAYFNMELKTRLISKILEKEGYSDSKTDVSDHTSLFMNELKMVEDNYVKQLFLVLSYAITLVIIVSFSIQNSLLLTVIFLSFSSIPPVLTNLYKTRIESKNKDWMTENKQFSAVLKDVLKGAETIFSYKAESYFIRKFKENVTGLEKSNQDMNNTISLSNAVIIALTYMFIYFPIGIGMYFVIQGRISLASFVAVQYSSSWIVNNFLGLSRCINAINSTGEIRKAIQNILEFDKPILPKALEDLEINTIEFENVSFSYKEKQILDQLNLKINSNNTVLLEGISGSGKSTFLNLITKKLTPAEGMIYINGHNLQDISREEWSEYISLIPQTVSVFNDSLMKNITLGRETSEKEVLEAVRKAGLQELVDQVGLDYRIGEDGAGLSGGQLKRLEIARAILFDKPILLIDEGNASLDKHTVIAINKTVASLNKLVIDVEHYVPEESIGNYTQKYSLADRKLSFI